MNKPKFLLRGFGCHVIIDIEYKQDPQTWNMFPNDNAEIRSITWSRFHRYINDSYVEIPLISFSQQVDYNYHIIQIESNNVIKTFESKKGYFTNEELLDRILAVEKESRPLTRWFGKIDITHVQFIGMILLDNGVYHCCWGG